MRPIKPPPQPGVKPQKARPARKEISTAAALPELKRVIVSLGNRIAMEEKLDAALSRVLSAGAARRKEVSPLTPEAGKDTELGVLALKSYNMAKAYLREGDWAACAKELQNLENILKQLAKSTGNTE